MIRKLFISIWIFSWSIFAFDQISFTFKHLTSTNTTTETSAISEKLLDSLNWNGPAMVEFKLDQNLNEYKLIEINPKLWGSLDLTIS